MVNFDKVTFEYIRRDEEGNVESINKALDEIRISLTSGFDHTLCFCFIFFLIFLLYCIIMIVH